MRRKNTHTETDRDALASSGVGRFTIMAEIRDREIY